MAYLREQNLEPSEQGSTYNSEYDGGASGSDDDWTSDASGKPTKSAKPDVKQEKHGQHLDVPGSHRRPPHRKLSTDSRFGDGEDSDSDGSAGEGGNSLRLSLDAISSQEKVMSQAGSFFLTPPPKE